MPDNAENVRFFAAGTAPDTEKSRPAQQRKSGRRIVSDAIEQVRRKMPPRRPGQMTRLSRLPRGRPALNQKGRPGPEPLKMQMDDILDVMIELMSEALCDGRSVVLRGFLALYFREIPPQRRIAVWRGKDADFITKGNFKLQVRASEKLQRMLNAPPDSDIPIK